MVGNKRCKKGDVQTGQQQQQRKKKIENEYGYVFEQK